jgi:CubicO group peptidase (beta-lactamase class C family)
MGRALMRKGLLLLALVIVTSSSVIADELTDKVDTLFEKLDSTVTPGAALAIIKDGRIIYARGYGMANLDLGVPLTSKSVFETGSTSKQYTAMCTAMLAVEGKIDLDASITKYLPELPEAVYGPVTVRHMIHHTSGIRDFILLQALRGINDEDYYNADDAVEVLSWQTALNFTPGERYLYSNSNYMLQAVIVERVTGKTLAQFAKERIFEPLGMRDTHFHDDHRMIVRNRATGYEPTDDGYKVYLSNQEYVGDGCLYTSVEDMLLWDQSFYTKPFGEKVYDLVHTTGVLNNGEKLTYAFGLVISEYKGLKVVQHGGAWVGYRAQLIRFPEQHFSVACLMNCSEGNPDEFCFKIADIYLADLLKKEPEKPVEKAEGEAISLPESELQKWVGMYLIQDEEVPIEFLIENGVLAAIVSGITFHFEATAADSFRSVDGPVSVAVKFSRKEEDGLGYAAIIIAGQQTLEARESKFTPPTKEQLAQYTGEYRCEDLHMTYSIVEKDGAIYIRYYHSFKDALQPAGADEFSYVGAATVRFTRNKAGAITGFALKAGRVSDLNFTRLGK